jgi:hypothetical protein
MSTEKHKNSKEHSRTSTVYLTHQTVKSTYQIVTSTHLGQADKCVFETWSY